MMETWYKPYIPRQCHSLDIIETRMEEKDLRNLDRKTRKLLTMNGGIHPQDCVARINVQRKDGGRSLISVEDCANQAKISLGCCVQSSEEELLKAIRSEGNESGETATYQLYTYNCSCCFIFFMWISFGLVWLKWRALFLGFTAIL